MVVVALRGSNIPVLPVPTHSSVLSRRATAFVRTYANREENRAHAILTQNFFPAALRKQERRRPMWFINETE
jgi:hypothetical protein